MVEDETSEGGKRLWNRPEKMNRFRLGHHSLMGTKEAITLIAQKSQICSIQETLYNVVFVYDDQVVVVEYITYDEEVPYLVYRCTLDATLNNWKVIEIPESFPLSK